MASKSIIPIILLALSYLPASQALGFNQQQQRLGAVSAVPFEFRELRIEDAEDYVSVMIDAFSSAPLWKYLHQFEDQYPGYLWRCGVERVRSDLENSNGTLAKVHRVIAVPDQTSESGSRVVSISIWNFNKTGEATTHLLPVAISDSGNCSQHLTMNKTRADQFAETVREGEHVLDLFGRQVYLEGLATHPEWDGNGFAAHHLNWGMGLADKMELPTTLVATPAGYPLYKSQGFKEIYNSTFEKLDGSGVIWHEVMKYSNE